MAAFALCRRGTANADSGPRVLRSLAFLRVWPGRRGNPLPYADFLARAPIQPGLAELFAFPRHYQ